MLHCCQIDTHIHNQDSIIQEVNYNFEVTVVLEHTDLDIFITIQTLLFFLKMTTIGVKLLPSIQVYTMPLSVLQ